jgi:hypothetical protein
MQNTKYRIPNTEHQIMNTSIRQKIDFLSVLVELTESIQATVPVQKVVKCTFEGKYVSSENWHPLHAKYFYEG